MASLCCSVLGTRTQLPLDNQSSWDAKAHTVEILVFSFVLSRDMPLELFRTGGRAGLDAFVSLYTATHRRSRTHNAPLRARSSAEPRSMITTGPTILACSHAQTHGQFPWNIVAAPTRIPSHAVSALILANDPDSPHLAMPATMLSLLIHLKTRYSMCSAQDKGHSLLDTPFSMHAVGTMGGHLLS
jgi:hypothetical protein